MLLCQPGDSRADRLFQARSALIERIYDSGSPIAIQPHDQRIRWIGVAPIYAADGPSEARPIPPLEMPLCRAVEGVDQPIEGDEQPFDLLIRKLARISQILDSMKPGGRFRRFSRVLARYRA